MAVTSVDQQAAQRQKLIRKADQVADEAYNLVQRGDLFTAGIQYFEAAKIFRSCGAQLRPTAISMLERCGSTLERLKPRVNSVQREEIEKILLMRQHTWERLAGMEPDFASDGSDEAEAA
jgi:hypothetical protein